MRAELKSLHSPDANLLTYVPIDPTSFALLVQAMIGPVGSAAAESFDLVLCTPDWLSRQLSENRKPFFGAQHLIVDQYDYERLWASISDLCSSIEGHDWNEVASKLNVYAAWEFADYVSADKAV
ncbi:MAG: immunity 8 family protein [Pigmentiphaga sp.]